MIDSSTIQNASRRLLEPYNIPTDCPYLSEEQQELSKLDQEKRSEWMGEWLQLASLTDNKEGKPYSINSSDKHAIVAQN